MADIWCNIKTDLPEWRTIETELSDDRSQGRACVNTVNDLDQQNLGIS